MTGATMIRRIPADQVADDALARLAALHAASFPDGEAWGAEQLAGSLALATTLLFVAEADGVWHGFLMLQCVQDEAEILTLCVAPAQRQKGFGRRLIGAAQGWSGLSVLWLEVAADNPVAQRLYERCGFEKTGVRPKYYKRNQCYIDGFCYRFLVDASA